MISGEWLKLLLVVALNTAGQLNLKLGSGSLSSLTGFLRDPLLVLNFPHFLLGAALYGTSLLIYVHVLSQVDLSMAYPFMGLTYVLVVFASGVFLNEPVGAKSVAGSLLIFAGLTIIGLEGH